MNKICVEMLREKTANLKWKSDANVADTQKVFPDLRHNIPIECQSLGNAIHSTFECLPFYIYLFFPLSWYKTQTHIHP